MEMAAKTCIYPLCIGPCFINIQLTLTIKQTHSLALGSAPVLKYCQSFKSKAYFPIKPCCWFLFIYGLMLDTGIKSKILLPSLETTYRYGLWS